MCGLDVHGLKRRKGLLWVGELGVFVEGGQVEDEEDQAVFAAIVGY